MRKSLLVACALGALLSPVAARAQATRPCSTSPCNIVFDWGNGGNPPDVDRRYGAPSELESTFISGLQAAGFRLAASGQPSSMTITLRLTAQNRALCDALPGVNPDYSCHTVQRGAVVFTPNDSTQKQVSRIDVNPRCSDPKVFPRFAEFGRYAAEMLVYQLVNEGKSQRPSIKCQ